MSTQTTLTPEILEVLTAARTNDDAPAGDAPAVGHSLAGRATPSRRSRWLERGLTTAMLACFALAGWHFASHPESQASIKPQPAGIGRSSQGAIDTQPVRLTTTPIEEIRLGQRVVGRNPLRHETSSPSNIRPDTWRAVRLTMTQHGVDYDLQFLRSTDWLDAQQAVAGHTIHLQLPEMGLDGPAEVIAINHCPPIEPNDGTGRQVVTGLMSHPAENILDLQITDLDEPLGVTTTHPIWSETRQTFVKAADLQEGEHLRSATGHLAKVTRITPRRGPPELVYNLEVDAEHVYQVAATGLLVHNDCLKYANSVLRRHPDGVVMRMNPVGGKTINLPGYDNSIPNFHHYFHIKKGVVRDDTFRRGIDADDYMKQLRELNPDLDFMFTPRL
jgi:hypothetical protein